MQKIKQLGQMFKKKENIKKNPEETHKCPLHQASKETKNKKYVEDEKSLKTAFKS